MHVGAAQRIDRDLFAGGRFHQWRAAKEHRAGAAHHDGVLAQGRHVGTAGGAVPEHHGDLRNTHLRQNALVAEHAAAHHVHAGKVFQIAARAVAEVHDRQAILDGDFQGAHDLGGRQGIPGAALVAGIVGVDHHLTAIDHADAGDDVRARCLAVELIVGGDAGEFEKGRAGVEQQIQALAHQQFFLPPQALDVALRAFVADALLQGLEVAADALHRLAVGAKCGRGG